MLRRFSLLFILTASWQLLAYSQYVPLDNRLYDLLQQRAMTDGRPVQFTMKPVLITGSDSSWMNEALYGSSRTAGVKNSLLHRKLFSENLLQFQSETFRITADPLFHFGLGYDLEQSKQSWTNTRGVSVTGTIGHSLSFNSELYENQAVFPSWPDSIIRVTSVVPGQGWAKGFKNKGYDFFNSNGYVSYSPSRYVDLTLGYGKNFIGDGYRSLLLSDGSFNYPYLKVTGNFHNVKYTVLYNQFLERHLTSSPGFGYDKKWSVMHFLQVMLWGRLNIGLFDAVIWENADSTGYRGFDVQYLNPVILLRPVEESFGSPDNALMGGTFNFRINKTFNLYGQLVLDEFKLSHMLANDGWWANKYGYQFGIAGWNIAGVPSLNARLEYNRVRPYTYTHSTITESYSHFNEPLAHPLGANFREIIGMASYTRGNWMANIKVNTAFYGADTAGKDFGKNIFITYDKHVSELGNQVGQGLKTNLLTGNATLSYLLNRKTNMRVEAGITTRHESNRRYDKQMMIVFVGIRTGLRNLYYDF